MTELRASQTLQKTKVKTEVVEKTIPDIQDGKSPDEEIFIARDRRTCDCALTYVHRKRHAALGVGIEIRLCCLAKKVEELTGSPPGTFFFAMEFEPTWTWDCDTIQKKRRTLPDGSVVMEEGRLGNPPKWLRKRMVNKGIKIKNLK